MTREEKKSEEKQFNLFKDNYAISKEIPDVNCWYDYIGWCDSNGFSESEVGIDDLVIEYVEFRLNKRLEISDDVLEDKFKELFYCLGEANWNILTVEAWDNYINKNQTFNDKQIEELKYFINEIATLITGVDVEYNERSCVHPYNDVQQNDIGQIVCTKCDKILTE